MPGYKGHLVGGSLAFVLVGLILQKFCSGTSTACMWLVCSLAGSLFPDVDVKSKGQKYGYWLIFFFFILLILCNKLHLLAFLSLLCLVPMLVRHRGIFHRLSFVIGLPLILWIIMSSMHPQWSNALFFHTLFFITGAVSHLLLDFGVFKMRW